MGFGGEIRRGLGLCLGLAMIALAAPAGAQSQEQETKPPGSAAAPEPASAGAPAGTAPENSAAPAAAPDPLSPTRLMGGPSLRETGRIAVMPAPGQMNLIENEGPLKSPNEKSIAPAASTLGTAPVSRPAGVISPRVLEKEIGERFTDIWGCRVEVARMRQVTPNQIVADRLLLRWTIEPDGSTGPTDVVATEPVDLAVMDCAKRVMSQWKFSRPRGGAMPVERPFTF
jgi:hypothetical protein